MVFCKKESAIQIRTLDYENSHNIR